MHNQLIETNFSFMSICKYKMSEHIRDCSHDQFIRLLHLIIAKVKSPKINFSFKNSLSLISNSVLIKLFFIIARIMEEKEGIIDIV